MFIFFIILVVRKNKITSYRVYKKFLTYNKYIYPYYELRSFGFLYGNSKIRKISSSHVIFSASPGVPASHIHIYMYIYIHTCVCVRACARVRVS